MISVGLDSHGDIFIDGDGNIALVDKKDQLKQKLVQRLLLFAGEWFLNVDRGIPWFDMLGTRDLSLVTASIAAEIELESEVISAQEIEFELQFSSRKFRIFGTIESIYGAFVLDYASN